MLLFVGDTTLEIFDSSRAQMQYLFGFFYNLAKADKSLHYFMTFALLFSNKPISFAPIIHLDNYQIENEKEQEFHGLTLDNKLNFITHTIKFINEISKSTDLLLRLFEPSSTGKNLTHSILRIDLQCCNTVIGAKHLQHNCSH